MKISLTIIALAIVTMACSQPKINESRQTSSPMYLQECDYPTKTGKTYSALVSSDIKTAAGQLITPAGAAGAKIMHEVKSGSRFTIVGETVAGDEYIIYFWDWDEKEEYYYSLNYDGPKGSKRFFVYPKSTIDVTSKKLLRQFAPMVGALTLPFKYRPQTGKFEKAFTIGISGGCTFRPNRVNEFTLSLLGFVSASAVTFDKYNTDPAANVVDPSERAAVTLGTSFMIEWERLQIGILTGVDMALDNEIAKWKHQGKPWLSIGIGVSLFAPSEVTSPGRQD